VKQNIIIFTKILRIVVVLNSKEMQEEDRKYVSVVFGAAGLCLRISFMSNALACLFNVIYNKHTKRRNNNDDATYCRVYRKTRR